MTAFGTTVDGLFLAESVNCPWPLKAAFASQTLEPNDCFPARLRTHTAGHLLTFDSA